ncbi:MAG TPA: response regulator transcription factor [Acidimicrobiales bacterium]|nr:response regulator transcription factor [Acidimicrobiales bacterium]
MAAPGHDVFTRRLAFLTRPSRSRVALRQFLSEELGEVAVVANDSGLETLMAGGSEAYDAVVVDVPSGERLYLCARLRAIITAPVVVLGDADGADAPACLDAGADDYLANPERIHEVAARLRALWRRAPHPEQPARVIEAGGVRVDLDRYEVAIGGRPVAMPLKQFRLLELLVANAGRVVSSRAIVEHVWGPLERVDRNTVQAHVARLRQTLGSEDLGQRIRALPGIGYTFPR